MRLLYACAVVLFPCLLWGSGIYNPGSGSGGGGGGGSTSGAVIASTQNNLGYYSLSATNTINGLSSGTSGQILMEGASGPPFWSSTIGIATGTLSASTVTIQTQVNNVAVDTGTINTIVSSHTVRLNNLDVSTNTLQTNINAKGVGTITGVTANNGLTGGGSSGGVTVSVSSVSLSSQVVGNLPATNLNSGTAASASTFWRGDATWATPVSGGGGSSSLATALNGVQITSPTVGINAISPLINQAVGSTSTLSVDLSTTANALAVASSTGTIFTTLSALDSSTNTINTIVSSHTVRLNNIDVSTNTITTRLVTVGISTAAIAVDTGTIFTRLVAVGVSTGSIAVDTGSINTIVSSHTVRLNNLDSSTNTITTRLVAVGVSTAAIAVDTGTLAMQTKCMIIDSPTDADNYLFFRAPKSLTVTEMDCLVGAATSAIITVQECDVNGASCGTTKALTCAATNTQSTSITDPAIASGAWMRVDVGVVTGTVGQVSVCIQYK